MARALYITALIVGSIAVLVLLPFWVPLLLAGLIVAWYRGWIRLGRQR